MELHWDGVPSLADALRMLKEQAARRPLAQWVRVVGGWTEFQFAEGRMPAPEEINRAAPPKRLVRIGPPIPRSPLILMGDWCSEEVTDTRPQRNYGNGTKTLNQ
jgi:hypothetical protein